MTVLMVFLLVVPSLLLFPAWRYGRRAGERWWFLLYYWPAMIVWVLVTSAGYGGQSLSNLVELPVVAAAGVVIGYIKIFLVDRRGGTPWVTTAIAAAVVVVIALALRTFVPVLPE